MTGRSRRSEKTRALWVAGIIGCLALAAARPHQAHRFDGEYGLRVGLVGDTVEVQWITRTPGPGTLTVLADGKVIEEEHTPADTAHRVRFVTRERLLALRYGGLDDERDRHETWIDRETGRRRPEVEVRAPDTLFVIGDVHGEFDTMTAVLRNAGIVDSAGHWAAGHAQLAVAGDMLDRGDGATRSLWFLYRLEREAADAGGKVHIVLGNHELMVLMGDLRYVSAKEVRIARLHGFDYARLFDPVGSLLGRWLTSKPGMIRIGDVLIAHGGVAPEWESTTLKQFDDSLAAYTHDEAFRLWADSTATLPLDSAAFIRRDAFFWEPNSVFWFRGYAQTDTLGDALRDVLGHFDATLHVVGHTPGRTIREAYGGALILTNTAPFGREVLRLIRSGGAWQRSRIGSDGDWMALGGENPGGTRDGR